MTEQAILEKLRAVMKKSTQAQVDWDKVTADTPISTLGFDSLSILDLTYDIQQEFKVEFEAEEMVKINTVKDMTAFLKNKGA